MDRLLPTLDDAANAEVRDVLRAVAGHTTDPDLRECIDDVLTGRRSIRDVLLAPALQDDLAAGVARMRAEWDAVPPAERARLLERDGPPG